MSDPIKVLGPDYPKCAAADCKQLAQDGYCLASCCNGSGRAYCYTHSHRPQMLLELVGHDPEQATFTAAEVRTIMMAMWNGAPKVFEAAGMLQMHRDIAERRADAKAKAQAEAEAKGAEGQA